MREIRTSGSEGGGIEANRCFLPLLLLENWASPPRPWSPINAVAVDPNNNLWALDRCETEDCVPIIELGPDGRTLKHFGKSLD